MKYDYNSIVINRLWLLVVYMLIFASPSFDIRESWANTSTAIIMARARAAAKPSVPKATAAAKPSVPKATTAAKPSVSKESPKIISNRTPVPNKRASGDKKKENAVPYTNKTLQDSQYRSTFATKQKIDEAYKKHTATPYDGLSLPERRKLLLEKEQAYDEKHPKSWLSNKPMRD
jgi:hypothetical protein